MALVWLLDRYTALVWLTIYDMALVWLLTDIQPSFGLHYVIPPSLAYNLLYGPRWLQPSFGNHETVTHSPRLASDMTLVGHYTYD